MTKFINFADIVEENGKTIRENRSAIQHGIPVGSLVELIEDEGGRGGLRLFVIAHTRDCDGSPLYSLSHSPEILNEIKEIEEGSRRVRDNATWANGFVLGMRSAISSGWDEAGLRIIKLPQEEKPS